ncbi:MAG: TM2 domain-containing protein, partial [Niameybacter sp.]
RQATSHLSVDELVKFARIFKDLKKNERTAYILWLFGGAFGIHRIYTGNYGTALGLIAITVFTLGLGAIAGLYDGVNIKRLVLNANKEVALQVVKEVKRKDGGYSG